MSAKTIWMAVGNTFRALRNGEFLLRIRADKYYMHILYLFLLMWLTILLSLQVDKTLTKAGENKAAIEELRIHHTERQAALVRLKPVAQPILDMFTKYSYTDCESDAQGRLLLPQRIRTWRLGDARDVEVNGTYNHVRIIPASLGKEQDRAFDEKYPDPLAFLTSLRDGNTF